MSQMICFLKAGLDFNISIKDMATPKVTVLMPVYNGGRYLRQAIESILGQTFKDFEFLIVNDGSTDNSVEIIESYPDARIKLIHNEENLGLVRTLNVGLKHARCEYLARMDADDLSLPQRLQEQVDFLDKNAEIFLCGAWMRYLEENSENKWATPVTHEGIVSNLIFNSVLAHPTVMLRLKTLRERKLCYDEFYAHAEDYELWARIAFCLKFSNMPKELLYYRRHGQNFTQIYEKEKRFYAGLVRQNLLRKLGVEFSEKEFQLHQDLSNSKFQMTTDFVEAVEKWLHKLQRINQRKGLFPEPDFSKVLSERLYRTCRHTQKLGWGIWKIFWNSSLSSFMDLALKNKIGFAVKTKLRL
jgi:glycosyltransferase involved in cell wall biosynthesis